MTDPVREIEHRMVMARPWDLAEDGSIWEITGRSPNGKLTFEKSLAIALVEPLGCVGDEPARAFGLIPGSSLGDFIPPSCITYARPLLLVHRDNPTEPYDERDQAWLS